MNKVKGVSTVSNTAVSNGGMKQSGKGFQGQEAIF